MAFHLKYYCNDSKNSALACKRAIEILETIRIDIRRESYRINYASGRTDPYELVVESLVDIGQYQEALVYAEKAKSRVLADYLKAILMDNESINTDQRAFVECLQLLKEIEEVQKNLEKTAEQQLKTLSTDDENLRKIHNAHITCLKTELQRKTKAFNKAYSELLKFDPDSASLIAPGYEAIGNIYELVDKETIILEFFQTNDKLYEFIIAKDGLLHTRIIDFSLEKASDLVWNLTKSLRKNLDTRSHEFAREVRKPLSYLFDILISPILRLMGTRKRIIFIPHLFWHYVPFSALWDKKEKRYLCDLVEIGSSPSASVLGLCLERQHKEREKAVILARDSGNIPYVYEEAQQLAEAFYPDCRILRDEDANLRNLTSLGENFDVVHIATHGYFNREQPYLSGIDIPPEPSSSRRSYVIDLFNLRLGCNLVTLSACDSGLSEITRADELIGLCRAVFYAGATSIMLSLWKVADKSTCYLMENFYWHYVKNQTTKTRALQLAMQAVRAKKKYAHPFFWAPFVVMGDWR